MADKYIVVCKDGERRHREKMPRPIKGGLKLRLFKRWADSDFPSCSPHQYQKYENPQPKGDGE